MSSALRDGLAIGAYIAALIGAISLFTYELTTVAGRDHTRGQVGGFVGSGLLLVFFIVGGFVWFRFLGVG